MGGLEHGAELRLVGRVVGVDGPEELARLAPFDFAGDFEQGLDRVLLWGGRLGRRAIRVQRDGRFDPACFADFVEDFERGAERAGFDDFDVSGAEVFRGFEVVNLETMCSKTIRRKTAPCSQNLASRNCGDVLIANLYNQPR